MGSGVVTCTVSSMSSQKRVDSRKTSSRSRARYRETNSCASALDSACPRKNTISARLPGRNSIEVRSAAQGSRPAPTFPERFPARSSAAGRSSVPLRPRNSLRSPVHELCRPLRSTKAIRPANSPPHGFARTARPSWGQSRSRRRGPKRCATSRAPIRRSRSPTGAACGQSHSAS